MTSQNIKFQIVSFAAIIFIVGCDPTNSGNGGADTFPVECPKDPLAVNFAFKMTDVPLDDKPPEVLTINGQRVCAGYQFKDQKLSLSAGASLFPGGLDNTLKICVPPDALHTGKAHPVAMQFPSGQCVASGSVAFETDVRFGLNYEAVWRSEGTGRICIYSSKVAFNQFDVVHLVELFDGHVRDKVSDNIHHEVDRRAANELNMRTILAGASGHPLASNDEPRCSNWALLP